MIGRWVGLSHPPSALNHVAGYPYTSPIYGAVKHTVHACVLVASGCSLETRKMYLPWFTSSLMAKFYDTSYTGRFVLIGMLPTWTNHAYSKGNDIIDHHVFVH